MVFFRKYIFLKIYFIKARFSLFLINEVFIFLAEVQSPGDTNYQEFEIIRLPHCFLLESCSTYAVIPPTLKISTPQFF